jgi:hypothetical protein
MTPIIKRQKRRSCATRKILLSTREYEVVIVEAIKTGIFKQNDIKLRIYQVTAVLPTLQVKFGSTLYSTV